jgi:hypothetical protein
VHRAEHLAAIICPLSRNSGSLSFRDPQEPVNSRTGIAFTETEQTTDVVALTGLGYLLI